MPFRPLSSHGTLFNLERQEAAASVRCLGLIDAILARADKEDAQEDKAHLYRRQGGPETGAFADGDGMTDG